MSDPTLSREAALQEAYSRGLLPPDMQADYEEALSRGLVTNSTPITFPTKSRLIQPMEGEEPIYLDRIEHPAAEAGLQGIDASTGSPVGRLSSGFADSEAAAADNYSKRLSEYYEKPVAVSNGDFGLEFVNPESGRRTLIDEKTLSFRDFEDAAAGSIPIVGTVAGAIGGSLVGFPSVGAGGGTFIGDAIRRGIGHVVDVRGGGAGEEALGAAGVGATEFAFSKGGEQIVRAAGAIRKFFKPQIMSADEASRLAIAVEQDQAIADEIAKRTGNKLQPFTGQLADDPVLLGHQSSLRTDPETARRFRKQEVQNESTLEQFYDELNPASETPNTVTGRSIQLEARDQTKPRVESQRDITEQAVEDLKTITRELPNGANSNIVNEATAAAAKARAVIKAEEDVAWNVYKSAIGLNKDTALSDIKIPVEGELRAIMRQFGAEAKQAVDPDDASGLFRLQPKAFKDVTKTTLNPVTGRTSAEVIPAEVDLWQLQIYLGSLKSRQRLARSGKTATDPQGRDIDRMVDAVQTQRDDFLKANHPDILDMVIDAEARTSQRATLFDKGLVSQLIRREQGEWMITDKQLVGGVIGAGDREAMEHLVTALSKHPAGVPTLQRSFLKYYRNEVVENGLPNGTLHRKFMENHKEAVEVLFPGDKRLLRLGKFEAAVTARIARFAAFEKSVKNSFRGKIQDISPEHVVNKVFTDKFDVKDVGHLMRLADAAGMGDIYSSAIRGQIRNKFFSPTTGINHNSLAKFISLHEEKLITSLGGRYVKDMQLLLEGLKVVRRSSTGISSTRRPGLLATISEGLARTTVARPLSPHGVALTKSIAFGERAKQRAWAAVVEDPKLLRAIIVNKNIDVATETGARILGLAMGQGFLSGLPDGSINEMLEEE